MRYAKLIYNPVAGDGAFKGKLDMICEKMQKIDWQIIPYRTASSYDVKNGLADLNTGRYQAVFAVGGDGTINLVINEMMQQGSQLPLAVYPGGTANDLATHLGMPKDLESWCGIIEQGHTRAIDLGVANGLYFHNVISAGLLTDVSYEVNYQLKNLLGKAAYYIKGIEKIPKFRSFKLELQAIEGLSYSGEIMLCLIMNGNSAGGFHQLAPAADSNDGLLDLILVKSCTLREFISLFFRLMQGEHLESDKVLYYQSAGVQISCSEPLITDMDGEKGPAFPLQVSLARSALKLFYDSKDNK